MLELGMMSLLRKSTIGKITSRYLLWFRRLNLFDYLILFLLLVGLIIFGVLRFFRQEEVVVVRIKLTSQEWWWNPQPPNYWYIGELAVGDIAYNTFGKRVAEVVDIRSFDVGPNRRVGYVELKLKATYDKQRGIYRFNYQPLQIGKPIELTIGKNNILGLVTHIGDKVLKWEETEVDLELYAAYPYVVEALTPGLKAFDSQGRVVAEVISVESRPASAYEFFDTRLRRFMLPGVDPNRRDVSLRLRLTTVRYSGATYFVDDTSIKVGNEIWIQFPDVVVEKGEISKVY